MVKTGPLGKPQILGVCFVGWVWRRWACDLWKISILLWQGPNIFPLHFFTASRPCIELDLHRSACLICFCWWLYFGSLSPICSQSWERQSLTSSEQDQSCSTIGALAKIKFSKFFATFFFFYAFWTVSHFSDCGLY